MDISLDIGGFIVYTVYAVRKGVRQMKRYTVDFITEGRQKLFYIKDTETLDIALLTTPEERELINHLASYTSEIISAAKDYDPTKITRYVTGLATLFHKFYNACRVKGENEGLMQARMALCDCVRAVIKNVLTMFNITCPESM